MIRVSFTKLLFVMLGLAMIGGSIHMLRGRAETGLLGERTEGTVVGTEKTKDKEGDICFFPVFEFKAVDGKSYTVKSTLGSNPSPHAVGKKVKIVYDRDAPNRAHIDAFKEMWLGPLILLVMGILFVWLGLYGRTVRRR